MTTTNTTQEELLPCPTPEETGVGEYCAPGPAADQQKRWILKFEDQDRGDAVFDDESKAREAFAYSESRGWNCHLFEHCRRTPPAEQPAVAIVEIDAHGSPKSFVYTGAVFDLPAGSHKLHLASKREQPADDHPCPHCHGITAAELVAEQNEAFEAGRKFEREQPAPARELLPLPEGKEWGFDQQCWLFTEQQMQAYGQQCATQATAALRAECVYLRNCLDEALDRIAELAQLREQADRDSKDAYARGYKDGYNRRDAEVLGCLV